MASGGATEDMFAGEEFEEKEAASCGIRAVPGSGLLHGHHKPVKSRTSEGGKLCGQL